MFVSRDTRRIDFSQVDGWSTDTPVLGRHNSQADGQSKRVIQVLEDMLRGCVLDFLGSWDKYIPLMEFAYNNSYQSNIGIAPYEDLYGMKC